MSDREAIDLAVRVARLEGPVTAVRDLSGGCIHRVSHVTLSGGGQLVAKTNRADHLAMFEEEAAGLRTLAATGTLLVPEPLAVTRAGDTAALLMTALEPQPATPEAWRRFGGELAALHALAGPRPGYGFDTDNHLGTTPQPNRWCDDWVRFNTDQRLGHQLTMAAGRHLLHADETRRVERVIDRLDELIPRRPRPALLHGDLWSGNALAATGGEGPRIAVIDPACSYGDGWADIAMMKLFGGFPRNCFDAYAAAVDDRDDMERRIAVYQLYHVLNHVNLFGQAYVGQAMALANELLK